MKTDPATTMPKCDLCGYKKRCPCERDLEARKPENDTERSNMFNDRYSVLPHEADAYICTSCGCHTAVDFGSRDPSCPRCKADPECVERVEQLVDSEDVAYWTTNKCGAGVQPCTYCFPPLYLA